MAKNSGGGGRSGRSGGKVGGGGSGETPVKGAEAGGPTVRGEPYSGSNYDRYESLQEQYNKIFDSYDKNAYGLNPPPNVESKLAKLRPKIAAAKKTWYDSLPQGYKDILGSSFRL